MTEVQLNDIPEPGQLVSVRRRAWVVSDVSRSSLPEDLLSGEDRRPHHLVTLSSVEDDTLDEELQVLWEIEPARRVIEGGGLAAPEGLDDPARLQAFLDAVHWGAVTNADVQTVQAPFRSGITIEDYQLDPVVRSIDMPRVNLLIADDVGLGKTIEAGLVVQELLLRHRARTVLVVCPASLQLKWKEEMLSKFGLEFRILDTAYLRELRRVRGIHTNPWTSFPRLITSMDWLKQAIPMRLLRSVLPKGPAFPRKFDMLIVDEAHNLAPVQTELYALDSQRTAAVREIAPHFEHRLFLSATPHNGERAFSSLLELLDRQRFARGVKPTQRQLAQIMVRRLKSDITDADGNPVFPVREILPLEVHWTDEEREIHAALQEYVKLRYRQREQAGGQATAFVLKLLKKRLFSSPAAFATTLEKHLGRLRGERSEDPKDDSTEARILQRQIRELDEEYADDDAREAAEEDAVEAATILMEDLEPRERVLLETMERWVNKACKLPDSKFRALDEWIETNLREDGGWTDRRVIVFTESRATQKWLVELLAHRHGEGERLMTMYGGMDTHRRETVKAAFQAHPRVAPVRILVATDTAAEGIDLQNWCDALVHWEIPWNPNVLEQRNGRIDRHGQKSDEVSIFHFVGAGWKERAFDPEARAGSLEGDYEFLMRAAREVDAKRELLGRVAPVLARQVEEAMLGTRSRLDLARAEEVARRESQSLRVERNVQEKVARLHAKLIESRQALRLEPENVRLVVETALDLGNLPPLEPAELPGVENVGDRVFTMPDFKGTWARCTEGLPHPHTGERRPITFDHDLAAGRDDVVLVHLEHRLVRSCLHLLRSEIWSSGPRAKLRRVTARTIPRQVLDEPAVVAWARLVIVGESRHRLHEELVTAGGLLSVNGFSRLNVSRLREILTASRAELPPEADCLPLLGRWAHLRDPLLASLEARKKDRMQYLASTLARRRDEEIRQMETVLRELEATIAESLAGPTQFELPTMEEQLQSEGDRAALEDRLAAIPSELRKEVQVIRDRYRDPQPFLFPVATAFIVPSPAAEQDR
jgi:superfamily II DNA or RNA helicase